MRIFVDTNVLFPFSVMDLMLALTENEVHELVWSDFLLDEWERVIVREGKRTPESAAKLAAVVREFFGEFHIAEDTYAHLVDGAPSSDLDDRRHIAAALASGADVIVTNNLADFPAERLNALGLRVLTPDMYLCELIGLARYEVIATVERLAAEKRNPPMTPVDLLERIGKIAPVFADRARRRLR
jgi:predicted nucleic acid-binding protein